MKIRNLEPPLLSIKASLLFIDIKTSGLRPDKDRIMAIDLAVAVNGYIKTRWQRSLKKAAKSSFAQIADELSKLLKNKIMVSHQADFVYSFLKAELERCNIALHEKVICSMQLSRHLFPQSKTHDLTAINTRLLNKNKEDSQLDLLLHFFSKLSDYMTPQQLQNTMKALTHIGDDTLQVAYKGVIPKHRGIYRCYDANNTLIYIGKSKSVSESMHSHFQLTTNAHKALPIAKQIKKIDWIKTHGEVGSFLLASKQVKINKPIFNRITNKSKSVFTIQLNNHGDYLALQVVNLANVPKTDISSTYGIFKNKKDAIRLLKFYISTNNLCYQVNSLSKAKTECFRYKIQMCNGACAKLESFIEYNERIYKLLKTFKQNTWPFKGKIAIKEVCATTSNTHYHIVDHWVYLDTLQSLDALPNLKNVETSIDSDIYLFLHKFISNEDNLDKIVEI